MTSRDWLRQTQPIHVLTILALLFSMAGAWFTVIHRIARLEERVEALASKSHVELLDSRVTRLERAVEEVADIKADVRYIRGLLEGRR
jgi:uncharacterized protein (UPF0335 family)